MKDTEKEKEKRRGRGVNGGEQYWGEIYLAFREREEYKRIIAAIKSNSCNFTFGGKKFSDMWEQGDITKQAASSFIHMIHKTMIAGSRLLSGWRSSKYTVDDFYRYRGTSLSLCQRSPQ